MSCPGILNTQITEIGQHSLTDSLDRIQRLSLRLWVTTSRLLQVGYYSETRKLHTQTGG